MFRKLSLPSISKKYYIIAVIIFVIIYILKLYFCTMRPMILRVAQTRMEYISNKVINKAVSNVLKNNNIKYSDIVIMQKDTEEHVSSISIDFVKMNRIKSDLVLEILEQLNDTHYTDIAIPLGNFLELEFLMGMGPKIPFRIIPHGTVYVDYRDEFKSMGINQTCHEVYLDINTKVSGVMPGFKTSSDIETSIIAAHTVIVGDVPETYTGVNEIEGTIEDYVLDIIE
ncbi:MAG: sporulation protein YunB [Ruminococcaceae bacterium]|nr:sporulation protein YunB [Oscillospiraceae bacterium]